MTKKLKDNTEILVIPDAHCKPGIDNERFIWAGKLAVYRKPDIIICIGDWADMQSLSTYEKGTVYQEGLRYHEDVNASLDALAKFHKPIDDYNKKLKKPKSQWYKPKLVFIVGNHEHRIDRYGASMPEMNGHVSIDDLGFKERGWKVIPFLEPYITNGIVFQHYFTSGIMGRPISGDNHANSLLRKGSSSAVCGHSHMIDYSENLTAQHKKICGLVVGCYFEHDEHYTKENNRFWRGLVYLRDVKDGVFTPEFLTMEWIRRKFS